MCVGCWKPISIRDRKSLAAGAALRRSGVSGGLPLPRCRVEAYRGNLTAFFAAPLAVSIRRREQGGRYSLVDGMLLRPGDDWFFLIDDWFSEDGDCAALTVL